MTNHFVPFLKGSILKRTFAFKGSKFFAFRIYLFKKGLCVQEHKQEVTKVVPLVKKKVIYHMYHAPINLTIVILKLKQTISLPFDVITKTCLINFDPHKPHFNIVKLGFIGLYSIFLISAPKHRLLVLIRTAQ